MKHNYKTVSDRNMRLSPESFEKHFILKNEKLLSTPLDSNGRGNLFFSKFERG